MNKILQRFLTWAGVGYGYTGDQRLGRNFQQTTAGPQITEETAVTIPAIFHSIRTYGQTIGSLPWDLMQIEDRGRSIARNHPVHRLLHDDSNEFQLAAAWRETTLAWAILYGNSFSYIERNGNFRPTALIPLLPDRTYPTRVNGELKYVTYVNGQQQTLEPYEVFHIAGLSLNGLTGVPLVRLMAESLGLTKAEEVYASAYFGNGGNYGGIVNVPGKLDDASMKNLRDSFQQTHGGLGNAFRTVFLEEGMTLTTPNIDAEKTQLIQCRAFQLSEIARIVGLAPHLLYDLSRSTNNNIEFQGIEAVTYSFRPWSNKLCQEANRKLLYESEKGVFEAVIDLKSLQQGSAKEQAETDQIRFNTCSLTPNEIRAKDGRNPIDGGDQLFINIATMPLDIVVRQAIVNMEAAKAKAASAAADALLTAEETKATALGQDHAPAEPNDNPPPDGSKLYYDGPAGDAKEEENIDALSVPPSPLRALQPIVAATIGRIMRREVKAIQNGLSKNAGDEAAMNRWMATHTADSHRQIVTDLEPVAQTITAIGGTVDIDAIAQTITEQTRADLETVIKASPLDRPDLLTKTLDNWQQERAEQMVQSIIGDTKWETPND